MRAPRRRTLLRLAGWLGLLVAAPACGESRAAAHWAAHDAAARALREGRPIEAQDGLLALAEGAPERATEALLHDLALAALGAGELDRAAAALADLAASEARLPRARAAFLRGNLSFARGEQALRRTPAPDLAGALAHVQGAIDSWVEAAVSSADWPAARRNVERALLVREALEARLAAAEEAAPPPGIEEETLEPEDLDEDDPPPEPGEEHVEPPQEAPTVTALSADGIELVLERLAAKEQEKLELRRARRAERSAGVERDW